MAVAWTLLTCATTTLLGASSAARPRRPPARCGNLAFSEAELDAIDEFAVDSDINLWAAQLEIP